MKTISNLLQEARNAKGLSKRELEELTHIRVSFIDAIEKGTWEELPDFSTTLGFVKSLSHFLDMDENQAVSVFRRDYPPKLKDSIRRASEIQKNNTRAIKKKFSWGPRVTFAAGILIVLMAVFGYLGFQYRKFNQAPSLTLSQPIEGQTFSGSTLEIDGKTDSDATILANNQPVIVNDDGTFKSEVSVTSDTNNITVEAKSRSGKVTTIKRKISFKP